MMTAILLFATWLFAWLPAHTHTPIIRVNLTAVDQLLLGGLSLFMLVVVIQRIRQYNNILSGLYCFVKHNPVELHAHEKESVKLGSVQKNEPSGWKSKQGQFLIGFLIEFLKNLDSTNYEEDDEENERLDPLSYRNNLHLCDDDE